VGTVFNALKKAGQETAAERETAAAPVQETTAERDVVSSPESDKGQGGAGRSTVVSRQKSNPVQKNKTSGDVVAAGKKDTVASTQPSAVIEKKNTHVPKRKQKQSGKQAVTVDMQRGDWDERLILATAATGTVAESFRMLRTRILHPDSGRLLKNVLVTSAVPQERKSFACANLGISFAQGLDHRALLVDCDLRKPSLGKMFGLPGDRGLVNYLRDKKELKRVTS